MARTNAGSECANCYERLRDQAATTPTGIRICDALCASGWMNGERQLKYLETVRKLKALIGA